MQNYVKNTNRYLQKNEKKRKDLQKNLFGLFHQKISIYHDKNKVWIHKFISNRQTIIQNIERTN